MQTKDIILRLVRACNPVTLTAIIEELKLHHPKWEELAPVRQDVSINNALNSLIKEGAIVLEVNTDFPDAVLFDLPH